jgi:tetratricopeptide (TPR) repeat protein
MFSPYSKGNPMKALLCAASLALALAFNVAGAAGDPGGGPVPGEVKDPVLDRVGEATSRNDWGRARALLRDALAREPGNADYHNLYAYAIRKGADPDMGLVFKHYNEALALDPKHKGAHEYLGEAYLMVGNVAKAREHLAQLDKLCFFPCGEYTELKKAIARHEKK